MNLKAIETLKELREDVNKFLNSFDEEYKKDEEYTGAKTTLLKINEAIEELEVLECKDRLAELEKVILDYYLSIGYQVGIGGWGFNIELESDYKSKQLIAYFCRAKGEHYEQIFRIETETTKEMFDKAIAHFTK